LGLECTLTGERSAARGHLEDAARIRPGPWRLTVIVSVLDLAGVSSMNEKTPQHQPNPPAPGDEVDLR